MKTAKYKANHLETDIDNVDVIECLACGWSTAGHTWLFRAPCIMDCENCDIDKCTLRTEHVSFCANCGAEFAGESD